MSNAKETLERIRQWREMKEVVGAYCTEALPDVQLSAAQLQGWVSRWDLETILAGLDAAIIQASKRDAADNPMTGADIVKFASAVMNREHIESLPAEERQAREAKKAEISAKRSAAGKAGRAKQLSDFAPACPDLPGFAQGLPTECENEYAGEYAHAAENASAEHSKAHSSYETISPRNPNLHSKPTSTPSGSLPTPPVPAAPSSPGEVWVLNDEMELDEFGGLPENEVSALVWYFYKRLSPAVQGQAPDKWRTLWAKDFAAFIGKQGDEVRAVIHFVLNGRLAKFAVRGEGFVEKYDSYLADLRKLNRAKKKVAQ
jgi:hypothetical protein